MKQALMSNRQWVFFSVKSPLKLPAHDTVKTPIKLYLLFAYCREKPSVSHQTLIKYSLMIEHITVFVVLPETIGCSCLQACTLWPFQWPIKRNDKSKEISLMLGASMTYQLPHDLSNSSYDIHT